MSSATLKGKGAEKAAVAETTAVETEAKGEEAGEASATEGSEVFSESKAPEANAKEKDEHVNWEGKGGASSNAAVAETTNAAVAEAKRCRSRGSRRCRRLQQEISRHPPEVRR